MRNLDAMRNIAKKLTGKSTITGDSMDEVIDFAAKNYNSGADIVVEIENDSSAYSANKTFEEIAAAFPNVKAVYNGNVFSCIGKDTKIYFHRVSVSSAAVKEATFIVNAEDGIEYSENTFAGE